jgi:hypothetical protein
MNVEEFLQSEFFKGLAAAIGVLILLYGYLFIVTALPESVQRRLFRPPRPPKPPSAFDRHTSRFFQKHGGQVGAFVVSGALVLMVEREAWWFQMLIIGIALRLAFQMGSGKDRF